MSEKDNRSSELHTPPILPVGGKSLNANEATLTPDEIRSWFNDQNQRFDKIMAAVIIVLGLGFVTLLIAVVSPIIDAWRFRASSYEDLRDKVVEQNAKVDSLTDEIRSNNQFNRLIQEQNSSVLKK